jgi:hypothetical protein
MDCTKFTIARNSIYIVVDFFLNNVALYFEIIVGDLAWIARNLRFSTKLHEICTKFYVRFFSSNHEICAGRRPLPYGTIRYGSQAVKYRYGTVRYRYGRVRYLRYGTIKKGKD